MIPNQPLLVLQPKGVHRTIKELIRESKARSAAAGLERRRPDRGGAALLAAPTAFGADRDQPERGLHLADRLADRKLGVTGAFYVRPIPACR